VTDPEHDSAYAFQIPLVALGLEQGVGVDYSIVRFTGRISPEASEFDQLRVPMGPYDPTKIEGARICDGGRHCKRGEPHLIVPSDHFVGPPATDLTRQLHRQLAGRLIIHITIGLCPADEEET